MSTWFAFWKKEWMELVRSGRCFLLLLICTLFGVMNPAITKLTPWLVETMSESLQESGFQIMQVSVDAVTSWAQFYKNIPMALIIAVLVLGGIFTREYQKGTLVLVVTKGLSRRKVYLAKALMCLLVWSVCFWLTYGITWLYNGFYWDNGTAANLLPGAALFWVFGLWVFGMLVFFSAIFTEASGVYGGMGVALLLSYVAGIFPKVQKYMPTKLLEVQALLTESAAPKDFYPAAAVAVLLLCAAGAAGLLLFDKKREI